MAQEAEHLEFEQEHMLSSKPMQLIVQQELSPKENLWLHELKKNIKKPEEADILLAEYSRYQHNKLYQSVMNIIIQANPKKFGGLNMYYFI